MKKLKLIFTSLVILLFAIGCEKDGGTSNLNIDNGATANITKISTTDTSINLSAIQNNVPINIGLTIGIGFGEVASMDIIGIYIKGTTVEKAVIKSNLTSFPATVNINQNDLITAFNLLNSKSDFGITDKMTISADITLKNGKKIELFNSKGQRNFGADISNSTLFSVSQDYVIACPLTDASIFDGNYKVVKDDWADYTAGAIIPVVYNAANGTLKFRVLNKNNPYLVNAATTYLEVTVNPATNTVTVASSAILDYGGGDTTAVTGTGTVASCTGDINLKLNFPGFGASGKALTLVKAP